MTHRADGWRLGWAAMVPLLLAAGCGPASDQHPEVPESALGVWVTESPAMAERVFEITPTELFFQTSPDSYTLHSIRGVVRVHRGDESDFDLMYRGLSGDAEQFRVTASLSELVIRNRPDVRWHRNEDPSRDWPWRRPAGI